MTIQLAHRPSQAANAMEKAYEDQGASSKVAFEPESVSRTQNAGTLDLQGLETPSLEGSTDRSRSTVSQTSTEEYCQIPFEDFSWQVKQLCEQLWRTQTYTGYIDGSAGEVDSQNTENAEPSGFNEFILEKMKGGGFNRVIGIDVKDSRNRMADIDRFVLRIPRFYNARLDRDVTALHFVRKYTSIPVPEAVMYDFTKANPLESPYIVQTRIQGHDLQANPGPNYYPKLTHNQKCTVAKEVGRILQEIQSVEHSSPGLIEATSAIESRQNFVVRHLDISTSSYIEEEPDLTTRLPIFQPSIYGVSQSTSEEPSVQGYDFQKSTCYFLLVQFGRLRASQLRKDPAMIGWCDDYERLATMAKQMNDLDLLGDGRNCLCHFDLNTAPRNIMARILPDESLVITGILDWDSAMFAPRFAGCVPPMWIWAWAPDDEDEDESYANDTPTTPEQQELKHLFEEAVGPAFLEYAYRPVYRLARTLTQFAIYGIRSGEDVKEVNALLDDWAAMYDIYTADKDYSDERSKENIERAEAEGGETAKELDDLENRI